MQPRGRQEGGEEQGRCRPAGEETRSEGREAAEGVTDGGRAVENEYAVKSVWRDKLSPGSPNRPVRHRDP